MQKDGRAALIVTPSLSLISTHAGVSPPTLEMRRLFYDG
jgi:hypothetical protein